MQLATKKATYITDDVQTDKILNSVLREYFTTGGIFHKNEN